MPEVVNCTLKMSADDTKIFNQVDSDEDRDKLQSDLKNLNGWADTWQLRFNVENVRLCISEGTIKVMIMEWKLMTFK